MIRRITLALVLVVLSVSQLHAATSWAVVIGVSKYQNLEQVQWLQYADQDARSYADLLKSNYIGVPPENVKLLTNEEATTKDIKATLGTWLFEHSGPDDTVYIYFAGHGVVDEQRNDAYLVTYDSDPKNLYSSAYSMFDLKRFLGSLHYRHLVLIEDACHSAAVGKETGTRDLEVPKINDAFLKQDLTVANQDVEKSDFILTAAGSVEKSYEDAKWGEGHGAFTYFLVRGLQGEADADKDGKIDAQEIAKYVAENVSRETSNRQHPSLANTAKLDNRLVLASNSGASASSSSAAPPNPRLTPVFSAPKGGLILSTEFAGGSVQLTVDNEPALTLDPQAPMLLELSPGSHDLKAERPGYKPVALAKIAIDAGTQKKQSIKLEPETLIPVGEWRNRLIDALSPTAKPADALKQLESLFTDILAMKQVRPLATDEMDLIGEVVKNLSGQYAKTKATAALKVANMVSRLYQMLPVFPENLMLEPDADAVVQKGSALLKIKVEHGPAVVQVDSVYVAKLDSTKEILVSPAEHQIRITRLGFQPVTQTLSFSQGETKELSETLQLASITAFVFSDTPDLQFVRDDGVTAQTISVAQALNHLREDQAQRLREQMQRLRLTPQMQVAFIPGISSGTPALKLQFKKDKYRTKDVQLAFADPPDALYENVGDFLSTTVVHLDKLVGTLDITSSPAGAEVLVDGKTIGVTPLKQQYDIGDYELTVKVGKTSIHMRNKERISVRDGETIKRNIELKPAIVFLGIDSANDPASKKPIVEATKYRDAQLDIGKQVSSAFSNYFAEPQDPRTYEYTRDFLLTAVTSTDADLAKQQMQTMLRNHIQKLRDRYESDLFLFGFFPTENDYLSNNLRLYLFSSFSTRYDVRDVHVDNNAEIEAVLKQIDQIKLSAADLVSPYVGLTTIDTELAGHSLVALRVDQNSPAATAGITEGDTILTVNGQPATSSKISEWIAGHDVGSELQLQIEAAGGQKSVSLKSGAMPRFLVAAGSRDKTLLNALLLHFEHLKQSFRSDPAQTNVVLLNEALIHMELNRWNDAIESLKGFDTKASNAPVLAPAISYYRAYCWEQQGDMRNATTNFESAAKEANKQLRSPLGFDFQTLSDWSRNSLR